MSRGLRLYLVGSVALVALAGCGRSWLFEQREPWRHEAEVECLKSGAVKEGPAKVRIEPIGDTFTRVNLRFGFMEMPNVPKALAIARKLGWTFDIMSTSFFLSRRALKPDTRSGMPHWQDHLFIGLAKSASDATDFFHIPTGRVVEVGTQITV